MSDDLRKMADELDHIREISRRLFRQQAVTISKSGADVVIQCENCDDAHNVFEWLTQVGGRQERGDEL